MNNNYLFFSEKEIDGTLKIKNNYISNIVFFTPWSLIHFITGCIFSFWNISYIIGFIIHTIYELYNLSSSNAKKKWRNYHLYFLGDSYENSIGDTIVFLLGMYFIKNFYNPYIFIFLLFLGIIFFSNPFQNFINKDRLNWINRVYKIKKKVKIKDSSNKMIIMWLLVSIICLIKI